MLIFQIKLLTITLFALKVRCMKFTDIIYLVQIIMVPVAEAYPQILVVNCGPEWVVRDK